LNIEQKNLLLSSLSPYTEESIGYSYYCLITTVGLWLGSYLLLFSTFHPVVNVLGMVSAAALNIRFFVLYHDYCHGALFKKRNLLVRGLFNLFGVFIFFPKDQWTSSHDEHHSINSVMNLGHENILENYLSGYFMTVNNEIWSKFTKSEQRLYKFRRSPLAIILGLLVFFCLPTLVKGARNIKDNWPSFISLLLHIVLIATIYSFWGTFYVLLYLGALFVATAIGGYIFYVQHNFPDVMLYQKEDWDYVDAALKSTSFFEMGSVMNWVTGNIGFHHIHHLNTKIPFYNLPKVMAEIPLLRNVSVTRWRFNDICNSFYYQVWDKGRQSLVPYSDLNDCRFNVSQQ
jgi:omega-6 fatty acid desaturase (delta-12 desaturase)